MIEIATTRRKLFNFRLKYVIIEYKNIISIEKAASLNIFSDNIDNSMSKTPKCTIFRKPNQME